MKQTNKQTKSPLRHRLLSLSKNIITSTWKAGTGARVSFEFPNRAFHYNSIQSTILSKSNAVHYNISPNKRAEQGRVMAGVTVPHNARILQDTEHLRQAAVASSSPFPIAPPYPPLYPPSPWSPTLHPFSLFETGLTM